MPESCFVSAGARGMIRARASAVILLGTLFLLPRADAAERIEAPTAAGVARLAGLSLEEALQRLRASGLRILFSDEIVRPTMSVERLPESSDLRGVLDEILRPHGLEIREGPGGVLTVVRDETWSESSGISISGVVRASSTGEAIGQARVHVPACATYVATDSRGSFEIRCPSGAITAIEVTAAGYSSRRMGVGELAELGNREVVIFLDAIPVFEERLLVTPSRITLLEEDPVAPLALGREEIAGLPQLGGDFYRALTLLPGTSSNDVSAQFHVRGGLRDETQVLLDGQELYDGFHLKDRDNAVSFIVPETIGEAELDTGGFPARYGDRMSGVLDMTSVAPRKARHLHVGIGVLGANLGGSGPLAGDRGGWMFEARRGVTDLVGRLLGDEDPAFWDVFAKLEWTVGDRQSLQGNVLATGDNLDFSEELEDESKLFETDYESTYAWLTHQGVLGPSVVVRSFVSVADTARTRVGLESEDTGEFEIFDLRESEVLGFGQDWMGDLGGERSLSAGWQLRRFETEYDYTSSFEFETPLAAIRHDSGEGGGSFVGDFEDRQVGTYTALRLVSTPSTTAELGLRWDRHSLTDESLVSPRFNLARRVGDRNIIRLAWGRYNQSQRTYELNVEDGERSFEPVERSEHRVLGFETSLGSRGATRWTTIRFELYQRDVDNPRSRFENLFEPVNTFPEVEPDRVRIEPERSLAEGVEVFARGGIGRRFGWWATYSWAFTEDLIDGEWVPRLFDERHSLKLDLNVRPSEWWNLNAAWRFHTGWPTTPVSLRPEIDDDGELEMVPVLGPLNSERLSDYHRLDVRISRRWSRQWGSTVAFVDVQNVYDRRNAAGFDLEVDDDGSLTSVQESWTGILPSAGVRFEF